MDTEELHEYEPTAGDIIAEVCGVLEALTGILFAVSDSVTYGDVPSGKCFDFLAATTSDCKEKLLPYAED